MQICFWFVPIFEHVKFVINGKYSKQLWQSKLLCFLCDIWNIQKCSFKECPFTWVAPLSVILPKFETYWFVKIFKLDETKIKQFENTIIQKKIKSCILENNIIFEYTFHTLLSCNINIQQTWIKIYECLQNIIHSKSHLIIMLDQNFDFFH